MSSSWRQPLALVRITTWLVGLLCLGLVAIAVRLYLQLPEADTLTPTPPAPGARVAWPEITLPTPEAWSALQGGAPPPTVAMATDEGRFRLVGTYFMQPGGPEAEPVRKAVLDDLQQHAQILVEEEDEIDGSRVRSILRDRVILLTADGREIELHLRFGTGDAPVTVAEETATGTTTQAWDEVTLETSRFGRRIDENRWILSRNELLTYREELLNDPERLASLFVSMKADRVDRSIEGYRLEREGEEAFWEGVGLKESDVIRRANSMKMTRQERAEYLISEFVANRLNVVVLDIERDGTPQKLIYYLRE